MARDHRHIHPIGCPCRRCAPAAPVSRLDFTIRALTRALLLLATLMAVPFIIAHALACARGDNR